MVPGSFKKQSIKVWYSKAQKKSFLRHPFNGTPYRSRIEPYNTPQIPVKERRPWGLIQLVPGNCFGATKVLRHRTPKKSVDC